MKVRSCALWPTKKPVWVCSLTRIMATKTADIIISSLLESLRASKAFWEGNSTWEKSCFYQHRWQGKNHSHLDSRFFAEAISLTAFVGIFSSGMCFFFSEKVFSGIGSDLSLLSRSLYQTPAFLHTRVPWFTSVLQGHRGDGDGSEAADSRVGGPTSSG